MSGDFPGVGLLDRMFNRHGATSRHAPTPAPTLVEVVPAAGRVPRASWWSLGGLLIGIVGLVVQAVAEPARFADAQESFGVPFPPGILFVLAAALLMVATCRWRWHPVFAVLIGLWIVGAGAPFLLRNLASPVVGTVAGNVVMAFGLVGATVAGIVAIAAPGRRRRTASEPPAGEP